MDSQPVEPCPSPASVADFLAGRLEDEPFRRLEEHLEKCPRCQALVNTPLTHPDPFLDHVRRVHQERVPHTIPPSANTSGTANAYFYTSPSRHAFREPEPFFVGLQRSGLFDDEEMKGLRQEWKALRATDISSFAHTLVLQGRLTEFQAGQLLRGQDQGWVLDDHIILKPISNAANKRIFHAWQRTSQQFTTLEIIPSAQNDAPTYRVMEDPAEEHQPFKMAWLAVGAAVLGILIAVWVFLAPGEKTSNSGTKKAPAPLVFPFTAAKAKAAQAAWAEALEGPVEITNTLGMALRLVPPGTFVMGTPADEVERRLNALVAGSWQWQWLKKNGLFELPSRPVKLTSPVYMSRTEVTVAQFRAFVEATNHVTQAERDGHGGISYAQGQLRKQSPTITWRRPGYEADDNFPVTQVSLLDAQAFCRWLSEREQGTYTLPTEAQWEFACRAGSAHRWFWGDDSEAFAEFVTNPVTRRYGPSPVAQKQPNAFGLFDMSGNVWEWTADRFDPEDRPNTGTTNTVRGGSFLTPHPDGVSSTTRLGLPAGDSCSDTIGFRVMIGDVKVKR